MPVASLYTFCTQADVETRLTQQGVQARLDADLDGAVSPAEQQAMTDSISDASETVLFFLWSKYTPEMLQTSAWVNRRCVDYAAYQVCKLKQAPVPDSVMLTVQEAEKALQAVQDGSALIPLLPLRMRLAPTWSNSRVDVRYQFKCIRVEQQTCPVHTGKATQQPDYPSQFTVEL